MHSTRFTIAAVALAVALPGICLAAKADRKNKKNDTPAAFATVDKNSDGSVSKEEFMAAMKEKLGESAADSRFTTLDKNSDGKLTKEEYDAGAGEAKKRRRKNSN
ncbi:MAG: EF-hand domain-containing protein [Verrucomicrobia bacterium]|jgi:Ca2+-binding EF-hand superfamily protein|nr:EF-hand domain-containing protein [Verrucomicrobiota bacterium]